MAAISIASRGLRQQRRARDRAADALRDLQILHAGPAPAAVLEGHLARIQDRLADLFNEERVALALGVDPVEELRRNLLGEHRLEQLARLLARQACQLDPLRQTFPRQILQQSGKRRILVDLDLAVGQHEQHRHAADAAGQVVHELQAPGVGPMDVVDKYRQRGARREAFHEKGERLEGALLLAGRVEIGRGDEVRATQGQIGRKGHQFGHDRLGQRKARRLGQRAAQDVGKRRKGRAAFGETLAASDLPAGDFDVRQELPNQAGLADPGLPGDEQHLLVAGDGAPPMPDGLAQFLLSSDQASAHDSIQQRKLGGDTAIAQDPIEQAARLARRRRPVFWTLGEEGEDDGFEGRRQVGPPGARRNDRGVQVERNHRQRILGGERELAGNQFIQHDAQGIQVRPPVDGAAHRLFRSKVEDRPYDLAALGQARGHRLGQAEVHQFDLPAWRQKDVLGLQVAVDDSVLMGVIESLQDPVRDGDDRREFTRRIDVERPTLDQLHHDERRRLPFHKGLTDIVDRDDVGMIEAGGRLRLGQDALPSAVLARRLEHFDRHRSIEQQVAAAVDDAHAAAPQLVFESVSVVEGPERHALRRPAGNDEGYVIVRGRGADEGRHRQAQALADLVRRRSPDLPQRRQQPFAPEEVPPAVGGVGQAVGVEQQEVAALQHVLLHRVREGGVDGQRQAGRAEIDDLIGRRPVKQWALLPALAMRTPPPSPRSCISSSVTNIPLGASPHSA
jgi:hypothetical protein